MAKIKLHPKQGKAWKSIKRIVMCCSGIQGGKSYVGALKLLHAVYTRWPYSKFPRVSFAVTAPDHKSMVQSTRLAFDRVFYGRGKMNEFEQIFKLIDGRKIFFRTMIKNPNAVEGIPDCVFIWGDEAGQYPRMAYINIESRTALMQGQAFFTTTPYALNWVKHDVIDKWKDGVTEIDYYEWLSVENPVFPKEEYERQKRLLSKKEFERKYMGMHTKMEGLIFEDFDDNNVCDGEVVDLSEARIFGGIDWGFDHPCGLSIRAIIEDRCYGISFVKSSGLSVTEMLDLIRKKHEMFHVERWFAGHDRPDMIKELNERKIPVSIYFEGQPEYREINAGNQKLAELIKTNHYQIFRQAQGFKDLRDEYETYHWALKEGDEEHVGPAKPKDCNNDLISAERYVTVGTHFFLTRPKDKWTIPGDYHIRHDRWRPSKSKKSYDAY